MASATTAPEERFGAAAPSDRIPHIAPEALRAFSRISPLRGALHIAAELAAIFAAIWVCETWWHPALYLLAIVWIGARQHALAVMAHDAAHYRVFPDRRVNDLAGELLLAWPLLLSMRAYRRVHRLHHRYLNTARDPDWTRNRPERLETRQGWRDLARILLGLGQVKGDVFEVFGHRGSGDPKGAERWWTAGRAAFLGGGLAAIVALGFFELFLLYWIVPLLSWFLVTLRICGTAEHFAVEREDSLTQSRTTRCGWLERLFIAPKNVHYHLEHHLFPSVPFYHLPALRRELLRQPGYRERAHVTRGYLGFLRECIAAGPTVEPRP